MAAWSSADVQRRHSRTNDAHGLHLRQLVITSGRRGGGFSVGILLGVPDVGFCSKCC